MNTEQGILNDEEMVVYCSIFITPCSIFDIYSWLNN